MHSALFIFSYHCNQEVKVVCVCVCVFSLTDKATGYSELRKRLLQRFWPPRNMDISAVNYLSFEEFVNIFGNVVEKSPMVAAAVWSQRPFLSFTALEAAINEFIDLLPQSGINIFELTLSVNDLRNRNALDAPQILSLMVHR